MAIPIQQTVRADAYADDNNFKTLDTRVAGGRRMIVSDPPKVGVTGTFMIEATSLRGVNYIGSKSEMRLLRDAESKY